MTDGYHIDVVNPEGAANEPCIMGTEDASKLANCPVKSGPFYAYRLVFPIKSEHADDCHHLALLFEFWPVTGRILERVLARLVPFVENVTNLDSIRGTFAYS